jgi:hypothetical protein
MAYVKVKDRTEADWKEIHDRESEAAAKVKKERYDALLAQTKKSGNSASNSQ